MEPSGSSAIPWRPLPEQWQRRFRLTMIQFIRKFEEDMSSLRRAAWAQLCIVFCQCGAPVISWFWLALCHAELTIPIHAVGRGTECFLPQSGAWIHQGIKPMRRPLITRLLACLYLVLVPEPHANGLWCRSYYLEKRFIRQWTGCGCSSTSVFTVASGEFYVLLGRTDLQPNLPHWPVLKPLIQASQIDLPNGAFLFAGLTHSARRTSGLRLMFSSYALLAAYGGS